MLACAITALVYKNGLDTPFVFDDGARVLLNPSLVDPWNLRGVLLHDPARPILNLSYAIDRVVWGLSSFGFHVTSGVLHIVAVGLFFGWCTRALSDEWNRTRHLGTAAPEWPAFFATAVFAVHPVIGSTVVYVSARGEVLCAAALLGAFTFARRAIVSSSLASGLIAALFGIGAIGSSAAAAALPILVLAYDAWVLRDAGWRRRLWRVYAPAMVCVAIASAWRLQIALAADRVPPRGLAGQILAEAIVLWRYLALLLYPHGQALVHDVRWPAWTDPAAIAAAAAAVVSLAGAFAARRSRPLVAFGVLWFVAALAPSLVVPLRDAMTEPRLYVAAAGLLLAAASTLAVPLAMRRSVRAAATIAVVVLVTITYTRNRLWADPVALWQETVARAPQSWQAHLGYGELLRSIDRCDAAEAEYGEVLRLYPGQRDALAGMSGCR